MGVNYNMGFMQMLYGRREWKEFCNRKLLILGKQDVNFCCGKLKEILQRIGFDYRKDIVDIDDYDNRNEKLDCCDMFRLLGFDEVYTLDISDYEGADIIMDLTTPSLPPEMIACFDFIYDGGVLEHIFNAPLALVNMSKMLKKGGRIIHDVPCGNWIDHGFYMFSPTFFIDYYKNNGFSINDIHMVGYRYGDLDDINVVSPDCRFNDTNKWANTFANGYNIILICDAVKLEDCSESNISFTQYSYKNLFDSTKNRKKIYSYEYKINRARDIYRSDCECRLAIYGTGETANRMVSDLSEMNMNIIGVYDGKIQPGQVIHFNAASKEVLDIQNIHNDKISYVICGSENHNVIDIIRQRIKYLKLEGVEII